MIYYDLCIVFVIYFTLTLHFMQCYSLVLKIETAVFCLQLFCDIVTPSITKYSLHALNIGVAACFCVTNVALLPGVAIVTVGMQFLV